MELKEKIFNSVNQMNVNELLLLYEHIKIFKEMKQIFYKKREVIPIEKIIEMTSSSDSCWSDTVIKERAEQL